MGFIIEGPPGDTGGVEALGKERAGSARARAPMVVEKYIVLVGQIRERSGDVLGEY